MAMNVLAQRKAMNSWSNWPNSGFLSNAQLLDGIFATAPSDQFQN
jgi:hypothetical protein